MTISVKTSSVTLKLFSGFSFALCPVCCLRSHKSILTTDRRWLLMFSRLCLTHSIFLYRTCKVSICQLVDNILIGNNFHTFCDSDLDLWPSDPYFNWGHLLFKANGHVKYRANRSICWQVIDRKRFSHLLWHWSWPLTYWPQF